MRSGRDITIGRRQFVTESRSARSSPQASLPAVQQQVKARPAQHAQHAGRRRADRLSRTCRCLFDSTRTRPRSCRRTAIR